jgi:hypothetical protein
MPKRSKKKSHYHTGTYPSIKGGECSYRSGWELAYMQYLDSNPDVASFEYETLKLPYISNYKTARVKWYIPDVLVNYVNGEKKLVEIKPKKKTEQAQIVKKAEAGRVWCSEHGAVYEFITEIELKQLGLMK